MGDKQNHFVLVHGACHGAWCWFKLKPLLEAAGHRVSAFDLTASGTDINIIQNVTTLSDYTKPLLEFMATVEEKVVLVGHSLGGMNISLAMENFPEKVAVGVFLTAFMPDLEHESSYVIDQFEQVTPKETWMDTKFVPYNNESDAEMSMLFGPKCISTMFYQLCSDQDIELCRTLSRPSLFFLKDLKNTKQFTKQRFGSVRRAYIICDEDAIIKPGFQRWVIDNNPVDDVKELKHVDHMAMLCDPKQVCACLLDIGAQFD